MKILRYSCVALAIILGFITIVASIPASTPKPVGSCCLPDGSCSDGAGWCVAKCDLENGTYNGDGTECLPATCEVDATGACCRLDGSCSEGVSWDQAHCELNRGTYNGDGSECSSTEVVAVCDALADSTANGACCRADGSCDDGFYDANTPWDAAMCSLNNGTYQGNGTTCSDAGLTCGPAPNGACCRADGSCSDGFIAPNTPWDAVSCGYNNGTYQGDGTECSTGVLAVCEALAEPTGACCRLDGSCSEGAGWDQAHCELNQGTYNGDGSECSSATCVPATTGACCRTTGSCNDGFYNANTPWDADMCSLNGGDYQGDDTTCSGVTCP